MSHVLQTVILLKELLRVHRGIPVYPEAENKVSGCGPNISLPQLPESKLPD